MGLVDALAQAIARFETGNFNPSSIAMRQHNPGNLRSWGNYPIVNGYVQFPDDETGMAALKTQVSKNISRGLTLREFFGGKPGVYGGYAPAADANNPGHYAETVASWVGLSPDVPLNTAAAPAAPAAPAGFQWPDLAAAATSGEMIAAAETPPVLVAALVIGGASALWLAFA